MVEDIRIPVKVGGVTFKNPFYVASGPTTKNVRQLQRIEETGWAAASIKLSIDPAPYINRKPRYGLFDETNAHGLKLFGHIDPSGGAAVAGIGDIGHEDQIA